MKLNVATAKWPVGEPRDFSEFAARVSAEIERAAAQGADIAVLPEYLSLELAATFEPGISGDLHASLAAIQAHRDAWLDLFTQLARGTGLFLVAGTFLLDLGEGRYRNRADVFSPDGMHQWQDKLQLTGFEKAVGVIAPGDQLKVFDLRGVRAGIAICYDSEFPLPVRAQCEAGARLLLVPSCTDTAAGATRVRVGCLARALENRCFVAQSVTAGDAPWSPALDTNTGEAAIYTPMDVGLPADGVLATTRNDTVWAVATLDFDALEASRAHAQVSVDRDWPAQLRPSILHARVEPL
ncbi:carbon-nitrogen hydrolase family protein [Xanthomonadaceae bacterium XH05]|nr:carbon-nitrogen hydrolase family protein [Xanthomonadaceae bacterium XH05]